MKLKKILDRLLEVSPSAKLVSTALSSHKAESFIPLIGDDVLRSLSRSQSRLRH